MKQIDLNNPKLTAYALGELDPAEAKELEACLSDNPEARGYVEEIRSLGGTLAQDLALEKTPAAGLDAARRAVIERRIKDDRDLRDQRDGVPRRVGLLRWFMEPYRLSAAMAVCLAIMAGIVFVQPNIMDSIKLSEMRVKQGPGRIESETRARRPEMVAREPQSPARESETLARQPETLARGPEMPARESLLAPQAGDGNPPGAGAEKGFSAQQLEQTQQDQQLGQPKQEFQVQLVEQAPAKAREVAEWGLPGGAAPASLAPTRSLGRQEKRADLGFFSAPTSGGHLGYGGKGYGGKVDNLGVVAPSSAPEQVVQRYADTDSDSYRVKGAAVTPDFGYAAGTTPLFRMESPPPSAPRPVEPLMERRLAEQKVASAESIEGRAYFFSGVQDQNEPRILALVPQSAPEEAQGITPEGPGTEDYAEIADNPFKPVSDEPLSTFSIDVDTASYSNIRRILNQGNCPPKDAVRIEEMVNYFPYSYAPPTGEHPFAAHADLAACPWNPTHRLARIGIKGKEIQGNDRAACNLVFLVDVSGSMQPENKLPLVKRGMLLLLGQLKPEDRVAIVTYAGSSGLALPSTACKDKPVIQAAIEALSSGGSTNGAEGILLAYKTAQDNFIKEGINRVILATDGDFNVGVTDRGELEKLITDKAKSGVFLSVFGFGMGNLKDSTLETLADKGNGNYGYIDTLQEARKVFVEQMAGTLVTIAKDVKIQIEFNPGKVGAYRLIGYENRVLAAQDFNDDRKDAGEIGAGHTVTALYEIVPAGVPINLAGVDPLKYQKPSAQPAMEVVSSPEMFTLKLRYKAPDGDTSKLIEQPVMDSDAAFDSAPADFKFAAAVASFGMLLRESPYRGNATLDTVAGLAHSGKGDDREGYRAEFVQLVELAKAVCRK